MTLQDYFVSNVRLEKEWAADLNTEDTALLKPHSQTKVWWRCEKGHEWRAALHSRIYSGRGCPFCTKQVVIPGETDIASADPRMAQLWHPTKNGGLKPTDLSPGSRRQVWWQCARGHSWQAPPYSIKAGTSCPYCFGRYAIPGETDLATTHPQLLRFWSGRNTLSPAEVTAGSHKKAWWVCERGHEWESLIVSYAVDGSGCPYCAGKRAIPGETDLATQRPDLMEEWDPERNTLDPRQITLGSHDKVWWRCHLGHSWQSAVFSRTRENAAGCPYCTGRMVLAGFNDLATLRPRVAQEWYQPLNGELTPEQVSLGSNKKVWWQCAEGHVWQAVIYSRTRKKHAGCPVCAGVVKQRQAKAPDSRRTIPKAHPRTRSETGPASVNA